VPGFHTNLRRLREAKGLTPYRLAKLTGMSKQGALNLELPGANPRLVTLVKVALALGVSLEELVGVKPKKPRGGKGGAR
jgi:transcriptional regulator with XRE-family HTH domain